MTERIIGREVRIYSLCEPGGVNPRYIGKTVYDMGVRQKDHLYRSLRKTPHLPVHRWIRKLYKRGLWLCIKLIEIVPADRDWAERERYWIKRLRDEGHDLLNLTGGGDGLHGLPRSQEVRDKIAAGLRTGQHFNCISCGTQFYRKRSAIEKGQAKFCGRSCSNIYNRGGHRG